MYIKDLHKVIKISSVYHSADDTKQLAKENPKRSELRSQKSLPLATSQQDLLIQLKN